MKPVTCSRCDRCWSSRGLNGHWCGNINGPYIEKYPLVNEVIQHLQDRITDLISIEWPEDKERISKLLQVTA